LIVWRLDALIVGFGKVVRRLIHQRKKVVRPLNKIADGLMINPPSTYFSTCREIFSKEILKTGRFGGKKYYPSGLAS